MLQKHMGEPNPNNKNVYEFPWKSIKLSHARYHDMLHMQRENKNTFVYYSQNILALLKTLVKTTNHENFLSLL